MNRKLDVSVVTSFDVDHFGAARVSWPYTSFPNVEVYAFMHHCLHELFEGSGPQESALGVLAKARKDKDDPARVARLIDQHFGQIQVAAIATFLPEIMAPDNLETKEAAQHALEFLVLVAFELRTRYRHPCTTLVLVGGSRFDGMWAGEDLAGDKVYVINRLSEEEAV